MFCRACGGQVEADDVFCPNCGKPRGGAQPSAAATGPVVSQAPAGVAVARAANAPAGGAIGLETICGAAMVVSVFLPWVSASGFSITGLQLAQAGGRGAVIWLVPLAGAISVVSGFVGKRRRLFDQISGAVPLVVLVVLIGQSASEALKALSFGAYLAVAAGAAMSIMLLMRKKA